MLVNASAGELRQNNTPMFRQEELRQNNTPMFRQEEPRQNNTPIFRQEERRQNNTSMLRQEEPQNKEYIQNDQQAIRHSSVIFVAPYWNYRISCLKVQLAPLAQDADSEKWNISLDCVKKGLSPDLEYFRLPTSKRSRLIIIMPSHCYWSWFDHSIT